MICNFKECSNEFKFRSNKKFCSRKCKERHAHRTNPKRIERFKKLTEDKRGYEIHKKDKCEDCGFIPVHTCQLDVDHIDGNHKNNDISNLKTLCANCHRLKTYINKDWRKNN